MMAATTLMSPRSSATPSSTANAVQVHRHRLNELPSGVRGIVQHIEGADAALHQLMAMGLCVGREIQVIRQGNPLILRLLGARIGVSSRLAHQIVVEHTH